MKKLLKILLIADFFVILSMGMIAPIYAIFVKQIGGDILDAGVTYAVFALISSIFLCLIGALGDKKQNYPKLLFIGYLLRALSFLCYIFVQKVFHLFMVQILLGISMAFSIPSYDALYSTYLSKGKYASEWGCWEAMNMIVSAIAALIGGVIAKYFGFNTLFIIMFLSGIAGSIICLKLMCKK